VPTPNAPPDNAVARFRADLTALGGAAEPTAWMGVAVSGGPDSLALLLLAHAALPGRIAVATVDHGLRPEAAEEAAMVGRICASLGIPHVTLKSDRHPELVSGSTERQAPVQEAEWMLKQVQHDGGGNIQHRARLLRYRLLGEWARKEQLPFIATAHHRDDVAESFLMRALRGSGVGGLARMKSVSTLPYASGSEIKLVRPLLGWSRAELGEIARNAGLVPANDPSNSDLRYDRVRIRALLAREDMLDPEPLARAAANLADADAALEWMADIAWRSRIKTKSASEVAFDPGDLPAEIQRRLASRAITALDQNWDGKGVDGLVGALERGETATLAGVKASGGELWHFRIAPARTFHR